MFRIKQISYHGSSHYWFIFFQKSVYGSVHQYLARHEERVGVEQSDTSSYTIILPCSPAALKLDHFQGKWWLIQIWQTVLNTFYMLHHRLPTLMTLETGHVVSMSRWLVKTGSMRDAKLPPALAQVTVQECRLREPSLLIFQDEGRPGFLCEISQFLNVGKAHSIFETLCEPSMTCLQAKSCLSWPSCWTFCCWLLGMFPSQIA